MVTNYPLSFKYLRAHKLKGRKGMLWERKREAEGGTEDSSSLPYTIAEVNIGIIK